MVSANSLPGDPLYGVKRASESVALLFTFDEQARAGLLQQHQARRVLEVKQVVEAKREVDVEFKGTVDDVQDDLIVVQGISVRLASDTDPAQRPAVGSEVRIEATTKDDGTVAAKVIAVRSQPAATPTLAVKEQQRPTFTPIVQPTDKPTATATREPTPIPTEPPTATTVPTEAVEPTDVLTATETTIVTATNTPSPTWTPALVPTAIPSSTPVPPPQDVYVRFEGRIDEVSKGRWTVSGRRVEIGTSTRINQEQVSAEVGGWAIVEAVKKPDGRLVAREIIVVRGAEQPPEPTEFSGMVESIGSGEWTIAGRRVIIVAETSIEGDPAIGALAHVKADRYSDDRLVAKSIRVDAMQTVQFSGIIESLSGDRWVVSGQEIRIDSSTQIDGKPKEGAVAEVTAVVRGDGSKLARTIRVILLPEPTAEAPSATPSSEPTDSPPATAVAVTETPSVTETSQPDASATPEAEPTVNLESAESTPTQAPSTETETSGPTSEPTAASEETSSEGFSARVSDSTSETVDVEALPTPRP